MNTSDGGYEYVNARLRAMRTRLFDRFAYEQMLAAPDVQALIGRLDQTPYHDAVEQSLVTRSGLSALLAALQLDHSATLRRIAGFCGGEVAAALRILLAPYTRHTLITLTRGVKSRADPAHILAFTLAIPPFSEGALNELARRPTVRALVDLLAQWKLPTSELAQALVAGLAGDHELGPKVYDPRITRINTNKAELAGDHELGLEEAFDAAWAATTAQQAAIYKGADANLLRSHLARYLDLHNLLFALDLRGMALPHSVPWLVGNWAMNPSPALKSDVLEEVRMAADAGEMAAALAKSATGGFWRPAVVAWDGVQPLALQQAWEQTLLHWRLSLFATADPLGPGILIAYLAAKDAEIRNLRLIAEAVAGNLSREEASSRLWS